MCSTGVRESDIIVTSLRTYITELKQDTRTEHTEGCVHGQGCVHDPRRKTKKGKMEVSIKTT